MGWGVGPPVGWGQALGGSEVQVRFEQMTQRFTNLRVRTEQVIEENLVAGAVVDFNLGFDVR